MRDIRLRFAVTADGRELLVYARDAFQAIAKVERYLGKMTSARCVPAGYYVKSRNLLYEDGAHADAHGPAARIVPRAACPPTNGVMPHALNGTSRVRGLLL